MDQWVSHPTSKVIDLRGDPAKKNVSLTNSVFLYNRTLEIGNDR